MKKIVSFPLSLVPASFDRDIYYLQLFSRNEKSMMNVIPLVLPLFKELKRYGIVPNDAIVDFAAFALSVVAADKLVSRAESSDGWTRMIDLTLYLSESEKWNHMKTKIEKMLRFLTGDFWKLSFLPARFPEIANYKPIKRDNDCVCLLSGGVDSLTGAIDLFTEGRNPLFVSQIIRGDGERQRIIAKRFGEFNHCQWSIGKLKGKETSTRSRSIAFIAFALLASCALSVSDKHIEIFIPENGFISLNVPFGYNRIGSLSTKTTHPIYIAMLQEILDTLEIKATLVLPYRFKTKGEILKECKDRDLLAELVFETNSCGKYQRYALRHCGVCVPCLIRRAAFLEAGLQDFTRKGYWYEDISTSNSRDIAAIALAVKQIEHSGIQRFVKADLSFAESNERAAYLGVISRGIDELKHFLEYYNLL